VASSRELSLHPQARKRHFLDAREGRGIQQRIVTSPPKARYVDRGHTWMKGKGVVSSRGFSIPPLAR